MASPRPFSEGTSEFQTSRQFFDRKVSGQKNNLFVCSPIKSGYQTVLPRATGPVLTSDKVEKHIILPTTLNFAVRRGKIGIYTLNNRSEVFCKFSPPEGYKEYAVVSFA